MTRFGSMIARFARDERGATAVEYGLIAGLIAIGILLALTIFGNSVSGLFNSVASRSGTAMNTSGI